MLPIGPHVAMYVKRTARAVQRCKNQQQRCSYGRDPGRRRRYASEDWLDRAAATVARLADGRRVVVIDGVGYPAVGSVCGTSNADVAARLKAPVCVVCKSGVGGAIDEVNFAAAFFAARDARVRAATTHLRG